MASGSRVLAHAEEVEKKVESEVKKVEAEESLCPDESNAKTEEKQAEPPVVEEVKVVVDENSKAGDKVEPTVIKAEDKLAEPVAAEEPGKTAVAPLAEPAEEKIESKPVGPSSEENIGSKPVDPAAEEKIESKPVGPSSEENIGRKPVDPAAEERIESTPAEPSAEGKIRNKKVETLAEVKIENKPVEPLADQLNIESKPVEPSTEEKIESTPVEPSAEVKIENKLVEPLAEEKIESELVEPSAEELKPTDVAESIGDNIEDVPVEPCLAEDQRNSEVAELTQKNSEDKPVEPPIVVEKKTEDAPIVEPSNSGVQEVTKEIVAEPDTACISGSGIDKAGGKVEERSEPEHDKNQVEESKPASIDEDSAKVCDVSESLPAEVVEEKAVEVVIEHKDTVVPVDDCELGELSEVVKQIEKDTPGAAPVKKVESGVEVLDVKLAKEEEIDAAKSLDQVNPESHVETKDVECYPAKVSDRNGIGGELEEVAKGTAEVKESSEGEDVVAEKDETKAGEVPCDQKSTKDAIRSIPPPEKAAGEITSRGIEQSVENETNKDQTVTSAESENACTGAGKELDITEAAQEKEEAVEAPEAKVEEKKRVDKILEESAQPTTAKREEAKEVDEPGKTDVQNVECTKDAEETKTDHLKEDVPVKSHKPSIVKMMKQSLVKAKKAIIGKSLNPKTLVQEQTKG